MYWIHKKTAPPAPKPRPRAKAATPPQIAPPKRKPNKKLPVDSTHAKLLEDARIIYNSRSKQCNELNHHWKDYSRAEAKSRLQRIDETTQILDDIWAKIDHYLKYKKLPRVEPETDPIADCTTLKQANKLRDNLYANISKSKKKLILYTRPRQVEKVKLRLQHFQKDLARINEKINEFRASN